MGNVKISQLPPVNSVTSTDVFPTVASGTTSKITLSNFIKSVPQVSSSISSSFSSGSISSSYATTASFVISSSYAVTASYVLGGATNITIEDESVSQGSAGTINFTGDGVSATVAGGIATVTINASSIDTGSFITTGSYGLNQSITGSLTISGSTGGLVTYAEAGYASIFAYDSSIIARDYTNNNNAYISAEDGTSTRYARIAYNVGFGPYIGISNGSGTGFIVTGSNWGGFNRYRLPSMTGEVVVNPYSGSFEITGSLIVTGSIRATSFTGSLFGTSSWAVSASWAPSAGGSGLKTKAGSVANSSFSGSPRKATVTFSTAFDDTNYAITVTGEDSRAWNVESKLAGSFVINSNSNTSLDGTTYWIATAYGETT